MDTSRTTPRTRLPGGAGHAIDHVDHSTRNILPNDDTNTTSIVLENRFFGVTARREEEPDTVEPPARSDAT